MVCSPLKVSKGSAKTVINYYIRRTHKCLYYGVECLIPNESRGYSIFLSPLSGENSVDYSIVTVSSFERDLEINKVKEWCKIRKFVI